MRINSIGTSQSFKAQLSPEVKQGFLDMLDKVKETSSSGRAVVEDIDTIVNTCPHIKLSIKKYDLQGDIYYGYMKTNTKTGKSVGISYMEDEKKDLFSKRHLDEVRSEVVEELVHGNSEKLPQHNRKGVLDDLKEKLKNGYHIVSIWMDKDSLDNMVEKKLAENDAKAKAGIDSDFSFYETGVLPDGTRPE